jgi:hypothetical protein
MHQNCIQSKGTRTLQQFLTVIRIAGLMTAFLSPVTVHAQEYPWCVSREGNLYCFYKTQEQCQWTASGIGGCALNPRLLFPITPRDSTQTVLGRIK